MNIMLTGAGGFIGTNLYKSLSKKYNVHQIYSSSHINKDTNSHIVDLTNKRLVEEIAENVTLKGIYAIIHLASKVASPDAVVCNTVQCRFRQ